MRARTIKPGFFKSEVLASLPPIVRIVFQGLWCLADREGRLEDRPARIKAEILPYDNINMDEALTALAEARFIVRYVVEEVRCIQILSFAKHQKPHPNEVCFSLPAVKFQEISGNYEKLSPTLMQDPIREREVQERVQIGLEVPPVKKVRTSTKKPPSPDEPPKYQRPDRAGNPRKPVEGCSYIWLSDEEFATVRKKLTADGLRPQFHGKAFLWVDGWFANKPAELAKSSEHKDRILTWGMREALKLQQESDRAMRAQGMSKAPLPGVREEPRRVHPPLVRAEPRASPSDVKDILGDIVRKSVA